MNFRTARATKNKTKQSKETITANGVLAVSSNIRKLCWDCKCVHRDVCTCICHTYRNGNFLTFQVAVLLVTWKHSCHTISWEKTICPISNSISSATLFQSFQMLGLGHCFNLEIHTINVQSLGYYFLAELCKWHKVSKPVSQQVAHFPLWKDQSRVQSWALSPAWLLLLWKC